MCAHILQRIVGVRGQLSERVSVYYVRSKGGNEIFRLDCKHLNPLRPLAGPKFPFLDKAVKEKDRSSKQILDSPLSKAGKTIVIDSHSTKGQTPEILPHLVRWG